MVTASVRLSLDALSDSRVEATTVLGGGVSTATVTPAIARPQAVQCPEDATPGAEQYGQFM